MTKNGHNNIKIVCLLPLEILKTDLVETGKRNPAKFLYIKGKIYKCQASAGKKIFQVFFANIMLFSLIIGNIQKFT